MENSPIKYEELKHIKNIESGEDKDFYCFNECLGNAHENCLDYPKCKEQCKECKTKN